MKPGVLAVILLVSTVALLGPAAGATIKGTAYDYNLKVLKGVVVEINTTPSQSLVLTNGSYSVELPMGSYRLEASYYSDGQLIMSDSQNVTVRDNGTYIIDLILLPEFGINESIFDEESEIGEIEDYELEEATEDVEADYSALIIALASTAAFLLFYIVTRSMRQAGRPGSKAEKPEEMPDDLKKVVELLKEAGGRMNQKDLREKLPYSEAKVSLMVSDLEERGVVKRFKKGRGNIIRLERS